MENSLFTQILDPADLGGIGTLNTRAQEPFTATQVDRWGPASMIDQISNFNLGFDPEATSEIRAKVSLPA